MLIDAKNIPAGTQLDCDVVIVGTGAAGMSVAGELLKSALSVIILEAGGAGFESDTQDLYKGEVLDRESHGPLDKYRQRRFGGTTSVWGGRCSPMDAIDFEQRSYVPHSGWPVRPDELDPYYARSHEYLELGKYSYKSADSLANGSAPLLPGLNSQDVLQDTIWRFSLPKNFAKLTPQEFKDSKNLRIYFHANCTHVQMDSEGTHVVGLKASSLHRNEFTVRAKYYVLATGGLEVTRLLLASRDICSNGIGNEHDLLGRFYASHISGDMCLASFTPKGGPLIWDYDRSPDGVYCRRQFRFSEDTQRREGLHNFRCILSIPPMADPSHGNPILSSGYLVKRFLVDKIPPEYSKELAGHMTPSRRAKAHLKNVLLGAPAMAKFSFMWLNQRIIPRRKLPSISLENRNNVYNLHFDAEQAPNPESRVTLSEDKDSLGVPRLRVDWKTTAADIDSVVRSFKLLRREFAASGVATMLAEEAEVAKFQCGVGSHHYGTTRMAADPSRGVVDSNCCVFGTDNLFIVSSATFPTASFANPTMTIVAFAIRVADRLKELCTTS